MGNDSLLQKVKKLLSVSDPANGATTGEIENALSLIDKLMREHNLSMSEVMAAGDENIDVVMNQADYVPTNFKWHKFVAMGMGKLCECEIVTRSHPTKRGTFFIFVGTKHDTDIAKEMFTEFIGKIHVNARYLYMSRSDQRSYSDGYALQLFVRCEDLAKKKQTECESTALIFVGKKSLAIKDYFKEKVPNVRERHAIKPSKKQSRAFIKGAADARDVEIQLKEKSKDLLS